MYAILTENVTRVYQLKNEAVHALRGVNLQIEPGHFIALKGRSGSGKTTLLNCIGGLDNPTSGRIYIYGRDLVTMNDQERTAWRRSQVGFIFQSFGLLPTLSAYENVELMVRIAAMPRQQRRDRAMYCLELVGLGKWSTHRPYEMSGGQQQRVAIARAIANEPKLILADEATGELDTDTTHEILSLFSRIVKEEKMTMFLVSHDELVEEYVDRVLELQDGQVVSSI